MIGLSGATSGTSLLRLPAAFLLLNGALLAPHWILSGGLAPPWLALEALLLVGVAALLPANRWSRRAALGVAILLAVLHVVALGDVATRLALGRPLNLYLDLRFPWDVYNLLTGTLGTIAGVLVLVGLAAAAVALGWTYARLLGPLPVTPSPSSRREGRWEPLLPDPPRPVRTGAVRIVGVGLVALFVVGAAAHRMAPVGHHVGVPGLQLAVQQAGIVERMLEERERFAEDMASAPASYGDEPGLLDAVSDHDVLLVFLESYGESTLAQPRYAEVVEPRLRQMEARLEEAGLHVASGTMEAPIRGGESWLAHATALSGLRIDNDLRYDLLLAEGRETLLDDFRRAGHRTAALMPAITMAWPEGERMGYDTVFAFEDFGYEGPPLHWVTIPDQFTLWFLEDRVRERWEEPLFAVVALISSHAPWTPVLPVLEDWEAIGDGSIFHRWEDAGIPPRELWQDTEAIREKYPRAVEYSVHAVLAYAERFVDEETLLVALGDHQPAPLVTGDEAGLGVPVHVVSGDAELVEVFGDWGFRPGAVPEVGGDESPAGMEDFRHWFVRAMSGDGPPSGSDPSGGGP